MDPDWIEDETSGKGIYGSLALVLSTWDGGTRQVTEFARMAGFGVTDEGFFTPSFVCYSINEYSSQL